MLISEILDTSMISRKAVGVRIDERHALEASGPNQRDHGVAADVATGAGVGQ